MRSHGFSARMPSVHSFCNETSMGVFTSIRGSADLLSKSTSAKKFDRRLTNNGS
jgi:hypothetical protein